MGVYTIVLPDVGEGIAEAELVEWNVAVGDTVREDDVLGTVMTDKAAVEVPSTVTGRVVWLAGEPGDTLAIGSKFIQLDVDGQGNDASAGDGMASAEPAAEEPRTVAGTVPAMPSDPSTPVRPDSSSPDPEEFLQRTSVAQRKPIASPAVRKRAREAGVDLRQVTGSGPAGRIGHDDLDAFIAGGGRPVAGGGRQAATGTTTRKVVGMRRRIAEKMALSKSRIPHITIVEEVDVTALEALRAQLNAQHAEDRGKLTVLPFIATALVRGIQSHPGMNARFDDEAGEVEEHAAVHIGIATQTEAGLAVPVVNHAEARSLWDLAAEIDRLATTTRDGKATRDELTGSTITITSLGPLGAIATTPIINHPEVAIVGVNKMAMRPIWDGAAFQPRMMMNLSCSFDHRVIDGWDAATFVRTLKTHLETPALLFLEDGQ
ncbi:MAG: dihydrolipoamide acetyltransferase family protein [Roseitalea porphyridii]|jgi:2-oxoisovalerate dehydrogenase E2 component (dihydrolipoyl transacylase)|uniref:dihydrolipoamide acetyltransferase family protein n=1 Tax=Alphaproteobacteria TaxID=28211 RepID=UPI0032EED81F